MFDTQGDAMKSFAVFLVVIAGTMWAGSGLAAQHFLAHNDHTAMDLTVFRMISTALIIFVIAFMRGTLGRSMRILKEYPTLWIKLIFTVWGSCLCSILILRELVRETRLWLR